jgi:peptidoglycan/LPS O-acetylase OafA/YrhL
MSFLLSPADAEGCVRSIICPRLGQRMTASRPLDGRRRGTMTAERFNWKEIAQLVGGIALIALLQVGLLFPETQDFVGSWLIMMLFGVIYAVIGGATTSMFEKRRRSSKME